ncbi:plasmid maintenance system antidote protein VapI [Oxalobacteraceae bacterium GrIS 2.11]
MTRYLHEFAKIHLDQAFEFGTTPEFWLNLQIAYDLRSTQKDVLKMIEKEIQPLEFQDA